MPEGKVITALGAGLAILGTLVGGTGIEGPERADVILTLVAIVALALCQKPRPEQR